MKKIAFFLLLYIHNISSFFLVIDPSCNTRVVAGEYESTVSLMYAQHIQKLLDQEGADIEVAITRSRYEKLEPWQAVTFSNIVKPDLHISLQCFPSEKPIISWYYQCIGTQESIMPSSKQLHLVPIYKSQDACYERSARYAHMLYECAVQLYKNNCILFPPISCPCKQLLGVTSQAVVIECGIPSEQRVDFPAMIASLIQALVGNA